MQPTFNLSAYEVETIKALAPVRTNQQLDLTNKDAVTMAKLYLNSDFFPVDAAKGQNLVQQSLIMPHYLIALALESIDFLDMFPYMFEVTSNFYTVINTDSNAQAAPVPPLNKLGIETLTLYFTSPSDAAELRASISMRKTAMERETETTKTIYGQAAERRFDPERPQPQMPLYNQYGHFPSGMLQPNPFFNSQQESPAKTFFAVADMLKEDCDLEVLEFSGNARGGITAYLSVSKVTEKLSSAFYGAHIVEVVPSTQRNMLKVALELAPLYGANILSEYHLELNRRNIKDHAVKVAYEMMTTDYELNDIDCQKLNSGRLTNAEFKTKGELAEFILEMIAN